MRVTNGLPLAKPNAYPASASVTTTGQSDETGDVLHVGSSLGAMMRPVDAPSLDGDVMDS